MNPYFILPLLISSVFQGYFAIKVTGGLVVALLTVFVLFFSLYIASFAVCANSKFVANLYKEARKSKSGNWNPLEDLLSELRDGARLLMISILYLIIVYALMPMQYDYQKYLFFPLWGVVAINFGYTWHITNRYTNLVWQTAVKNSKTPDNKQISPAPPAHDINELFEKR